MGIDTFFGLAEGYRRVEMHEADDHTIISVTTDTGHFATRYDTATEDGQDLVFDKLTSLFDWERPVALEDPEDFTRFIPLADYDGETVISYRGNYVIPTSRLNLPGPSRQNSPFAPLARLFNMAPA